MELLNSTVEYLLSPSFKSHLENVYFLSGPLLILGVVIALKQLRQQKQLTKTSNRRDAYKIAAERCEFYGKEIIPDIIRLQEKLKAEDVGFFEKCEVEVTDESLKLDPSKLDKSDIEKINEHKEQLSRILNSLEGFALFFVTGVADDKVGFLTCGHSFVDIFEEFFPIYAMTDSLEKHNRAARTLYARWKNRIRQTELVKQKGEIEKKIDPNKSKNVKPYGC